MDHLILKYMRYVTEAIKNEKKNVCLISRNAFS